MILTFSSPTVLLKCWLHSADVIGCSSLSSSSVRALTLHQTNTNSRFIVIVNHHLPHYLPVLCIGAVVVLHGCWRCSMICLACCEWDCSISSFFLSDSLTGRTTAAKHCNKLRSSAQAATATGGSQEKETGGKMWDGSTIIMMVL